MASNLRQKLPAEDSLTVFDVDAKATRKLQVEHVRYGKGIEVVTSAREVAKRSVSSGPRSNATYLCIPFS